jgi:hypothetical protein
MAERQLSEAPIDRRSERRPTGRLSVFVCAPFLCALHSLADSRFPGAVCLPRRRLAGSGFLPDRASCGISHRSLSGPGELLTTGHNRNGPAIKTMETTPKEAVSSADNLCVTP